MGADGDVSRNGRFYYAALLQTRQDTPEFQTQTKFVVSYRTQQCGVLQLGSGVWQRSTRLWGGDLRANGRAIWHCHAKWSGVGDEGNEVVISTTFTRMRVGQWRIQDHTGHTKRASPHPQSREKSTMNPLVSGDPCFSLVAYGGRACRSSRPRFFPDSQIAIHVMCVVRGAPAAAGRSLGLCSPRRNANHAAAPPRGGLFVPLLAGERGLGRGLRALHDAARDALHVVVLDEVAERLPVLALVVAHVDEDVVE